VTKELERTLEEGAGGIDAAAEKVKEIFPGLTSEQAALIDQAVTELRKKEAGLIRLHPVPILSSRKQGRWYVGPRDEESPNWVAYRDHLLGKGWGEKAVSSIDEASTRITNELLCPNGPREDRFQGLVLGYVQSGKTASMAGTIAKAADSGYRMVIILAGITNSLRKQTQRRLEEDIVAHNHERWWVATTEEDDFLLKTKLPTLEKGKCVLLVVKKNHAVLARLKRALGRITEMERRVLPTLVIDDECDQASVNTLAYRNRVSRINGLIRDICALLPKVTYMGYTATPYANILMAETSVDGSRDLYPGEFIVSLDEPDGYFGVRKLFANDQGADRDSELPYIRRVPDEDTLCLQPPSRRARDQFTPELTSSLRTACDYFLLCLAARASRGQGDRHCCMLIHTTIYAACHRRLSSLVQNDWLMPLLLDLRSGDESRLAVLRSLWQREVSTLTPEQRLDLDCPDQAEDFERIRNHLLEAAESIEITVENSESELPERLDFTGDAAVHSIVIGGNILARGLTIEGLVCSFFIRTSSQYDTLMQMGRWFGYRSGYEDLPRIWITRELENAFRDLVNVEEMIRTEISEINRRGWTPEDMAIRVPKIASLSITARNKLVMENLEECDLSYYGAHEQTIGFPVCNEFHGQNWQAGDRFLREAIQASKAPASRKGNSLVFPEVDSCHIVRFLREYRLEKDSMKDILEFVVSELEAAEECMERWDVGLIGAAGARMTSLGGMEGVSLLNRTKSNPSYQSPYGGSIEQELRKHIYLKALMGVSDVLVDVNRESYRTWLAGLKDPGFSTEKDTWNTVKRYRSEILGRRPLLLLYPIDRESTPRGWNPERPLIEQSRLPLLYELENPDNLRHHILGMGIVFPEVTKATARHHVRLRLEKLPDAEAEREVMDDDDFHRLDRDGGEIL
jgi:hypothetical protein